MNAIIYKNLQSFILICIVIATSVYIALLLKAHAASTQVVVSGTTPTDNTISFAQDADIYTLPVTTSQDPLNVGETVSFFATADTPYSSEYYIAACTTDNVIGSITTAPECGARTLCVSDKINDAVEGSCDYAALEDDTENLNWFLFACDSSTGECTDSSSGTDQGDSSSPIHINHAPTFSGLSSSPTSADPGSSVTVSSIANDLDSDDTRDTVRLLVCSSNSLSNGLCTDATICSSTNQTSNPTCSFTLNNIQAGGVLSLHAYIFDNHDFASDENPETLQVQVNNKEPVISNVILNGGSPISLKENSSTPITVTANITDENSCGDIANVYAHIYRSGIGEAQCNSDIESNTNNCYAKIPCEVNNCSSSDDALASISCSGQIQYNADPTDVNTKFPDQDWLATIEVVQDDNSHVTKTVATGVELLSLIGFNVSGPIEYGEQKPAQENSANITLITTGNVGLDIEIQGGELKYGDIFIPPGNQEYSNIPFAFGSGNKLTSTYREYELNLRKTLSYLNPETQILYWKISTPSSAKVGTYSGTVDLFAIKGETNDW